MQDKLKKGFTLIETLFSILIISIIFVTFPVLIQIFTETVVLSENKQIENLNRLNKDLKYNFLLSNTIDITNNEQSIKIVRLDSCEVTFAFENEIISKTVECSNEDITSNDLEYFISGIDLFKVENESGILKVLVSSKYEDFNHEYYFSQL